MPFSFIDIETGQSRKIILLFLTMTAFYFTSALLVYYAITFDNFLGLIFSQSRQNSPNSGGYSILPSFKTFLMLLAVAFTAAFIHWIFSTTNMIKRILSVIGAKPLDPEDRYHLLLKNVVDEVSVATGGMRIEPYVIPSGYFNAFALSDLKRRAVIGVTEGLLTKINRRQLECVIAHEAAHLIHGDCLQATVSCSMASVYAGLSRMILSGWEGESSSLYRQRSGFPLRSLPLISVIFIMRFLTLLLNTWISREREFRADATAVRLTRDPLGLAESLYLISNEWHGNFLPVDELSPIFIINPGRNKLEENYGFFADLFATHPPIKKRLDILLEMGHADYSALKSCIKKIPGNHVEIPISSPERKRVWYALNEKIWHGPFSLADLANIQWLSPFTWVTTEDEMQVKSAFEYKEINSMLKKGLPQDLRITSCPSCEHMLERVYYEGIPIWRCRTCGGRLVNQERLLRIIVREDAVFPNQIKEDAEKLRLFSLKQKGKYLKDPESSLKCPSCGNLMKRTIYRAIMPYRMEIDICRCCDMFWLDKNELELIQYLIQGKDT
ncbi:MAG: zinc metalloprotease HtpX [Nitrospirota bacterium]